MTRLTPQMTTPDLSYLKGQQPQLLSPNVQRVFLTVGLK